MKDMETGNRYLLQTGFGSLFEVKCTEVTETAFKIFNVIQKNEQWLKKNDFGPDGSYLVYADLGLTAPESSPAPLESQEELWETVGRRFQNIITTPGFYDVVSEYKSKFILTRRTEGSCPCDLSPNCDCCSAGLQTLHEAKEFEL